MTYRYVHEHVFDSDDSCSHWRNSARYALIGGTQPGTRGPPDLTTGACRVVPPEVASKQSSAEPSSECSPLDGLLASAAFCASCSMFPSLMISVSMRCRISSMIVELSLNCPIEKNHPVIRYQETWGVVCGGNGCGKRGWKTCVENVCGRCAV